MNVCYLSEPRLGNIALKGVIGTKNPQNQKMSSNTLLTEMRFIRFEYSKYRSLSHLRSG